MVSPQLQIDLYLWLDSYEGEKFFFIFLTYCDALDVMGSILGCVKMVDMDNSTVVTFANNALVTQGNELIRGKISLSSLNEKRIFYSVLSAVNPLVPELEGATDTEIEDYYRRNPSETLFTFPIANFVKFWRLNSKTIYSEIEKTCQNLPRQQISRAVVDESGKIDGWRVMNAFEYAEYTNAHVAVRFTPSFMPYLINLAGRLLGYTNTPLIYAVAFKKSYSFKLLELLLQRADIGYLELGIDTIKELFDVTGKYDKFYHFSKYVLEPAVKEIMNIECESASVSFEPIRKQISGGRASVVGVRFEFLFPEFIRQKSMNRAKAQGLRAKQDGSQSMPMVQEVVYPEYQGPSKRALELIEESRRYLEGKNGQPKD